MRAGPRRLPRATSVALAMTRRRVIAKRDGFCPGVALVPKGHAGKYKDHNAKVLTYRLFFNLLQMYYVVFLFLQ